MTIKVKKNTNKFKVPFDRFEFKKLSALVEKLSLDIVLEAKANHRFTSRSNALERSIRTRMNYKPNRIISTFSLDNRIANYGKYIHKGFRSWKPDPFLKDAFDNKTKNLKRLISMKMRGMK